MNRAVATALCLALTPLALVSPASAVPAAERERCDRPAITDGRDDTDIDIKNVRFTSDCKSATLILTTHRPFSNADLNRWGVLIGPLEARKNDGCDGFTELLVVDGMPDGSLEAKGFPLRSCRSELSSWNRATARRVSPRSIAVTINGEHVRAGREGRWMTFAYSNADVSRRRSPDIAPRLAAFAANAFEPWKVEVSARTTPDYGAVALTLSQGLLTSVDHYEVRYRMQGRSRWTTISDIDPRVTYLEVTDMKPGSEYTIQARGVDGDRVGPWSRTWHTYIKPAGPVRNLAVTFEGEHVVITFDPPQFDGGNDDQYEVWAVADDGSSRAFDLAVGSSHFSSSQLALVPRPFTIWMRVAYGAKGEWASVHVDAPQEPASPSGLP